MVSPTEVTRFWVDEIGPKGWYNGTEELDASIRNRFMETWQQIQSADCESPVMEPWTSGPDEVLGLLILLDQFPRNMFRDDPRAFATDARARAVAKKAIGRGWDTRVSGPARQFFYLPLMHSECLADQDRAVRMMMSRMDDGGGNLLHAKAHREIIRMFGRFPYRNSALGRENTGSEQEFLDGGGYRLIIQELQEAA